MQDQLSKDVLPIVAATLTSALLSTGARSIDPADQVGSVLHTYWEFCAELENVAEIGRSGGR